MRPPQLFSGPLPPIGTPLLGPVPGDLWLSRENGWKLYVAVATGTTDESGQPYVQLIDATTLPNAGGLLANDSDVSISSPSNNDVLTYDSASGKWKNAAASGGGGSSTLASDTDVSIGSPADGDLLTYSASAGKWKNATAPVFPRAGAGPWQAWTPAQFGSINGNYNALGSASGAIYQFGSNEWVPVIQVSSYEGSQAAFAGGSLGAWSTRSYLKYRANILGSNGYNSPANTTFRAWLGFGENATEAGEYTVPDPTGLLVFAFRYSSDVDATIKCFVTSPFAGISGFAPAQIIDTGIAPDTNFHDFVIYFDATHVYFQIDGTLVGTVLLVGNPAGTFWLNDYFVAPFAFVQGLSGASANLLFEYAYEDFPLL